MMSRWSLSKERIKSEATRKPARLPCRVPQVRVRLLHANQGRGRFRPAHRTFGKLLVPSVRLAALALHFRGLATAESAFVTPLLLLGFRDHGRYLQPSAVPVHGHEREIRGGDFLARGGDVVLHQNA